MEQTSERPGSMATATRRHPLLRGARAGLALLAALATARCANPAAPADPALPAGAAAPVLRVGRAPLLTADFFSQRTAQLAAALVDPARGEAAARPTAVRWLVRDAGVATVDAGGMVEARRPGRTYAVAVSELTGAADSTEIVVAAPDDAQVAVIAHRGYALAAPENTLPALEQALRDGADAVEVDVVLTRDGVPIVMHDLTVDRTTNGRGAVAALTAAEVRALDACSWFGRGWAPCAVPTLDEALASTARLGGRILLDLKGPYTAAQLARLVAQVEAAGMSRRAMFIAFDPAHLAAIRAAEPRAEVGLLTTARTTPAQLAGLEGAAVLYHASVFAAGDAPQHAAALRAAGSSVGGWTMVTVDDARALVARGARRVISDVPLAAAALAPRS